MANNGFMVGESCVSGEEKAYQVCSLKYGSRATGANYIFHSSKGAKSFQCHLVSPVEYPVISNLVTPNCEIPGPVARCEIGGRGLKRHGCRGVAARHGSPAVKLAGVD